MLEVVNLSKLTAETTNRPQWHNGPLAVSPHAV